MGAASKRRYERKLAGHRLTVGPEDSVAARTSSTTGLRRRLQPRYIFALGGGALVVVSIAWASAARHKDVVPAAEVGQGRRPPLTASTSVRPSADDPNIVARRVAPQSRPVTVEARSRETELLSRDPSELPAVKLASDLLALPEDHINILDAALRISRELWPQTDVPAAKQEIEKIADRIAWWVRAKGGTTDPDQRIRIINTVLYHEFGYRYDLADRLATTIESQVLGATIATHKGTCATLPLLYYVVGERMGYPIRAAMAPQHMFLRYEDGTYRSNIEAGGSQGGEITDEQFIREIGIPPEGIRSGAYMRSLTKRELLANLLAGMGSVLREHGRWREAEPIYEMALAV